MVNAVSMLFYVYSLIMVFTEFIPYPNEDTGTNFEGREHTSATDLPDSDKEIPDANLVFWLKFEVLVFCANILSNVIFLLFRSCSINRIRLSD